MCHLIFFLRWLNEHGIWNILTFAGVGSISWVLWQSTRRLESFSLHMSYQFGTNHSLYPNVIYFVARNLNDSPIILARPNFRFNGKLKSGASAHGNLATGDYEIKFRQIHENNKVVGTELSHSTVMLRSRDSYMAYIPIEDTLTEENFLSIQSSRWLKIFWCRKLRSLTYDLVMVSDKKPKVRSMSIPVRNVVKEARTTYALGYDPKALTQ
jgi:hypothetical protein